VIGLVELERAGIRDENARTTPHSRLLMVRRVLEQKQPATSVAADFGISERTVRKWLATLAGVRRAGPQ
jgi:transposase-like protein